MEKFNFSGWATRANLKCSDGRTILKDAFKDDDGRIVPLVWNHQHNNPENILGHALLENRDDGVYAYCVFNDTPAGKNAKLLVEHGDVSALSIFANGLKQRGSEVIHGIIREVSLVLAGANPGAFIDSVLSHSDGSDEEAIIYTGEELSLYHASDDKQADENGEGGEDVAAETKKTDGKKTVEDVFNTLTEEQKDAVYVMIGQAIEDSEGETEDEEAAHSDENEEETTLKHNVFDQESVQKDNTLSHAEQMTIINDGRRYGSLKESFLSHAETYGIENIDYLFPDARNVTNQPQFIQREMGWVQKVMNATHHTPFSRIKSIFADITEDEARAKGYIKGKLKKEEVFSLLKRTTSPTTIYKKQKMDRDDVVDITDFDVVAWLKSEMRMMLDEEIARAILVGDGRLSSDDDKIKEDCIRPVWTDADLYTVKALIDTTSATTADQKAKAFIRTAIKARKNYKGSGTPTLFTTEDVLTDCLLIEDTNGRIIYDSVDKLATALRVKEIVTVPVMENLTRDVAGTGSESSKNFTHTLWGIIVNLADYNVGADKGGAINMFDDFDIDYNQQKYLIETRCSGALIKPYSAITLETRVEKN